ncbi:hypothetical protein LIER_19927 [Lithospermum erythrorhizon]|uniref:SWIM-type domain-containing protein n=1 Tax=Lithospermum erythrorhizon TaxID=34254 RepID=A0AAV3QML2_LITER
MLERIRRLIMERIKDRKFSVGCKPGPLCLRISKILDKRTTYADGYTYTWNGADGFEVYSYNGDHLKVDLRRKECSCRSWQLCDIPCIYAIPTIYSRKQVSSDHISNCYQLTTFGWIHNVKTCAKKKADYQNGGSCARGESSTQNRNEDEVIDPEQAEHDLYLQNLYDWINEIYTPVVQHADKEAPQKPRKKKQESCSQPIPSTTKKKTRFSQSQTEAAPTTSSQPIQTASTNTCRKPKSKLRRMSKVARTSMDRK